MGLAIVVHGGAGAILPERHEAARAGCAAAAAEGWRVLHNGGSALDAIVAAIRALEDNPGFNAGTGSVLTEDGRAQLDAGLMDGTTLDVGAIAGVERIKNPSVLARAVLRSPHVLLVGAGAELFAERAGIGLCDPRELVTPAQYARWQRGYAEGDHINIAPDAADVGQALAAAIHADDTKHGTVGAVAIDAEGHIAAGASTGGMAAKHPGRVGDTPLVGAGYYAEDGIGGASSTGHGEHFIRLLLAKRATDVLVSGGAAQVAATEAIRTLGRRTGGTGGLIVLDREGRVGLARNTHSMAYAYMSEDLTQPIAGV